MKYFIHAPFKLERLGGYEMIQTELCRRINPYVQTELCLAKKQHISIQDSESFFAAVLKRSQSELVVAFDERGQSLDSPCFARILEAEEQIGTKAIHFCIGGAYGLPKQLLQANRIKIVSLSKMTFCHELALINVLEQIYRARTILSGHPYHHGGASRLSEGASRLHQPKQVPGQF